MTPEADSAGDALTAESLLSNWMLSSESTDLPEMATEEDDWSDDYGLDDMEDNDWIKEVANSLKSE